MVYNNWVKKIKKILEKESPCFQTEIRTKLGNPDRAILTGYLRCLVDLKEILSKDNGRAKIYFVKKKKEKNEREKRN